MSAPETVHFAVTYRCEGYCPDCYCRGRISKEESSTTQVCSIIDDIANESVFQLAIGGGEPFIRPDLVDIAGHATNRGLAVHITTGEHRFESQWIPVLKHIKSLHVGIRPEPLIVAAGDHILNTLAEARKQVIGGDYRALYAVWEVYGDPDGMEEEDEVPPKPKDKKSGAEVVSTFKSMLTTL